MGFACFWLRKARASPCLGTCSVLDVLTKAGALFLSTATKSSCFLTARGIPRALTRARVYKNNVLASSRKNTGSDYVLLKAGTVKIVQSYMSRVKFRCGQRWRKVQTLSGLENSGPHVLWSCVTVVLIAIWQIPTRLFNSDRRFRKCDDSKPTVLCVYSGRSHVEAALLRGSAARPVVWRPWVSCLLKDFFKRFTLPRRSLPIYKVESRSTLNISIKDNK
jgi:hypothetical protein